MTRTILAAAALAAATALASTGAEACISCEYVPEVVRSSSTLPHNGHYYAAERYQKKERSRSYEHRAAKGDGDDRPVKAYKAQKAEKPAKLAKADDSAAKPAKVAKAEPKVERSQKQAKSADSESSSITVATAEPAQATTLKLAGEEPAAKPTDCKKFFASVGMTLTVPCE